MKFDTIFLKAVIGAQEEAAAITGTSDPEAAAHAILERPGAVTQWCVVKLGSRGAVLCSKSPRATYRQHALLVRSVEHQSTGFGRAHQSSSFCASWSDSV